jgi:hypothetical protein
VIPKTQRLAVRAPFTDSSYFHIQAGGDATWDRLAENFAKESSGKEQFVIHRSFDVPLDHARRHQKNSRRLSK